MKKTFSCILALVMLFCAQAGIVPGYAFAEDVPTSGQCGDNLTWVLDTASKTLTISGTGAMWDYDRRSILPPAFQTGMPSPASWGRAQHVVMEESVTTIGTYAFHRLGVETIVLPDSLESIGESAFRESGLAEIVFPQNLREIGDLAFYECPYLTEIQLSQNLLEIGAWVFAYASLRSVYIPKSVQTIGEAAFSGMYVEKYEIDPQNESFCAKEGVLFTKDMKTLIAFPLGAKVKHYTIPDTVEIIGCCAFYEGSGTYLEGVYFPDSVRIIEEGAFLGQHALRDVRLPRNLEYLARDSFFSIRSFACLEIPATMREIELCAFYLWEQTNKDVYFLGEPPVFGGGASAHFSADYVLYYPAALADVWAPNSETSYQGCNIAPYSYDRGDANCDGAVTAADAAAILRHIVKLERIYLRGEEVADVTGDGQITAADAAKILRWIVRLESKL